VADGIDLIVVVAMAIEGVLMAPVSPLLVAELLSAVAIYLFVLDQLKVVTFKHFTIR
jgi:H+-transporting ATPase